MSQTIELRSGKESANVCSNQPFKKIQLLEISSSETLEGTGPKGLRITLLDANKTLCCFSFQHPGTPHFDCFKVLDQFANVSSAVPPYFTELAIRCEGVYFSLTQSIGVSINIL